MRPSDNRLGQGGGRSPWSWLARIRLLDDVVQCMASPAGNLDSYLERTISGDLRHAARADEVRGTGEDFEVELLSIDLDHFRWWRAARPYHVIECANFNLDL